eukprot:4128494-Amphidinium_carterae.1
MGEDSSSEPSIKAKALIGGFAPDTKRALVIETLPYYFKYVSAVDYWALNLKGSIGLARFASPESMWAFIKRTRSKAAFTVTRVRRERRFGSKSLAQEKKGIHPCSIWVLQM